MNKQLLLLLCLMLFGATSVWAGDDDLYCCGQKQSSTYNWNYTTSNNIGSAITSGSISYDAASKTVTFDNTYATVTGDNRIFYNKNVEGLKIVFVGYCRLRSDKCVFRLDKDTEMQGSTDWVQLQGTGDNAQCIYCPNETELTITDAMKMSMTSKYWRAMETNGTHVTITNSRIYAQGADCAIHNNKGNDQKGWLHLVGCIIRDTWLECNGSVGGDPYIFNGYYNGVTYYNDHRVHTSPAKSVMIILDEDRIGVRLKGIALTKGWSLNEEPSNPAYGIEDYYTYDESTNTLTLKKDIQAPGESDEELNYWNWEPLDYIGMNVDKPITIDGGGHSVYGEIGMRSDSGVTLSNIIIAGNKTIGIDKKSGILTLKDNVIIGGIENAINGYGTVKFNPSAGKTVTLVPCDEDFRAVSTFTDKPVSGCSIQLVDCIVTTPEGGEFGTNGFEVDGNTVFSKVVVTGTVKYDLWVGETQVTSVNSPDILGDGGHFKYNALTKTLTVNNATLENPSTDQRYGGIYNYGIDGLTVKFYGKSTFDTFRNSICSKKDITLAGSGSLTATVGPDIWCCILLYDCTCTINGPQFDFTSAAEAIYDNSNNSTLNVMGSTTRLALHPGEGYPALRMSELNIGEGLYITEPLGGYFDSDLHSITVDGSNAYKGDVIISNVQSRELGFSINGQKMTTINMNDVPGVVSGIAYVTTDSNNNPILVLSDATLDWNDANAALYLKWGTELTINVQGDCVINAPDHTGLDLSGNTTITGGGTLRINSKWAAIETWDNTRFALQDETTLIAHSSNYYGFVDSGMDYYQTWFIIEDGGLFAAFGAGKCNPISMNSDRLVHFDSNIDLRYPVGGQLGNGYVYDADGNEVKNDWAVIGLDTQATDELIDSLTSSSRLGDVNLDGAVDIADAVCILNAMAGQSVAGNANVNGDYDANGNPVVDIADLVTVLNIMAGH
jgi:hypothetical protein